MRVGKHGFLGSWGEMGFLQAVKNLVLVQKPFTKPFFSSWIHKDTVDVVSLPVFSFQQGDAFSCIISVNV